MNLNESEPQGQGGGVIYPIGSIVRAKVKIIRDEATGQCLVSNKNGHPMLKLKFEIDAPQGGMFYENLSFRYTDKKTGNVVDSDISRSQLRGLVESIEGLRTEAEDADAQAKRTFTDPANDLSRLDDRFCIIKIGYEPPGEYPEKNTASLYLTASHDDYQAVMTSGTPILTGDIRPWQSNDAAQPATPQEQAAPAAGAAGGFADL